MRFISNDFSVIIRKKVDKQYHIWYYNNVNKKHKKTLEAIFKRPTVANIKWNDVKSLLIALGAELTEGSGSRLRIKMNNVRFVFHIPHPRPELGKGRVEDIRQFLINSGVKK